jgi:hypothetical protein
MLTTRSEHGELHSRAMHSAARTSIQAVHLIVWLSNSRHSYE